MWWCGGCLCGDVARDGGRVEETVESFADERAVVVANGVVVAVVVEGEKGRVVVVAEDGEVAVAGARDGIEEVEKTVGIFESGGVDEVASEEDQVRLCGGDFVDEAVEVPLRGIGAKM